MFAARRLRLPDAALSACGSLLAGALFLVCATSCKRGGTPDWDTPGVPVPAETGATPVPKPAKPKEASAPSLPSPAGSSDAPHLAPAVPPAPARSSEAEETGAALRLITFNVRNWLVMDRYTDRTQLTQVPKPEEEKQAVITLLTRHRPDVVGLCEIGTGDDLREIQTRLKEAGLDLPHSHHVGGSDPVRHLGLLSRFPIIPSAPAQITYTLNGKSHAIHRGIMDVTLETAGRSYRLLGVHLKSKRQIPDGDEELIRNSEARLLRDHVDAIFSADPDARLIVYGDFNDTRPNPPFRTVAGRYNSPTYLTAIPVKDSRGETWTYFWKLHEIYSRIDFVATSPALRPEVDRDASRILDDPEWKIASDHRPILTVFR